MPDDTSAEAPSLILIRYPNLFGAMVSVSATEHRTHARMSWSCHGCLDGDSVLNLSTARDRANTHAATCRALPQTPATTT